MLDRGLINRPANLRLYIEDEDGTATNADGAVTVTIYDGAGTAIVTAGAAANEATGQYVYALAPQTKCDQLRAVWSYALSTVAVTQETQFDLAERRLIPLAQLRTVPGLTSLTGTDLRLVATTIEDWFERGLGYPPIPRGLRAEWDVERLETRLRVPGVWRPLEAYEVTRDGTDITADIEIVRDRLMTPTGPDLSFLTGVPTGTFLTGRYTAHLRHGLRSLRGDLRRAAVKLAEHAAKQSDLPDRARRIVSMDSEIWLAFPSPDNPTGLPEVDATLESLREQRAV